MSDSSAELVPSVRRLVVVGGSLGAARVAEEARALGYAGAITVIGAEPGVPYNRPPLSKEFLTAAAEPPGEPLIDADELDVRLLPGTRAVALDSRNRRVRTDQGDVDYDVLVIATGARPRQLEVAKAVPGVTAFRSIDHARTVRAALRPGARVVVIGAGFIGCEIASSARAVGAEVTLVEIRPLPLVDAVGSLVAERLAYLHEQYGVTILPRRRVRELIGRFQVEKVRLDDGTILPADIVVVGIGVEPDTGWLRGSGVAVSDGVACSPYLETTVPGVYAVGDVARWVNQWNGRSTRLEHWTAVGEQAAAVVRNALTADRAPCAVTPYFWSDWYGHRLQLLGEPADEVELLGGAGVTDPFLAQYRYDGQLVGAFAFDQTRPLMKLRGAIDQRASWQAMLRDTSS